MSEQTLQYSTVTFGCDPEMFFATGDGKIIGAEKVLPVGGVLATKYGREHGMQETPTSGTFNPNALVLDGVQVELNPRPSTCRETLGTELALTFRTLKEHLAKMDGVKVSFNSIVTVDKQELAELSERARQLGCMPSLNAYTNDNAIKCNPATYRKRSAGGHIHIGLYRGTELYNKRERLIPIMDAIVGNTCVLIDRHPEAAERRKNYGRAGEYRLPNHGIEYRTLSNFWLQSYQLFSMVMGLTRMAVSVLATTISEPLRYPGDFPIVPRWNAEGALMKRFNLEALSTAINTNDYKLAYANYKLLKDFIREYVADVNPSDRMGLRRQFSLTPSTLEAFDHFLDKINTDGVGYWFPQDPMEHWSALGNTDQNMGGWEYFLRRVKDGIEMRKLFGRV